MFALDRCPVCRTYVRNGILQVDPKTIRHRRDVMFRVQWQRHLDRATYMLACLKLNITVMWPAF